MKLTGIRAASMVAFASLATANSAWAENSMMEEVVVTAQLRSENLQDVPVAITAMTEKALQDMGARSFTDYARFMPSLSYSSRGDGNNRMQVRGISPPGFGTQATTAIYFDDTPVAGQFGQPDMPLIDIQRVELLRGPQGTLFGEGAVGGVLRIISNRPNTDGFSASIGGDTSNTKEGGTNYLGYGVINIPLSEKVAFRASATYSDKSGWIDSPGNRAVSPAIVGGLAITDLSDMNQRDITSGRMALRFEPTDDLTIDLMYTYTSIQGDGVDVDTSDPSLLNPGFQPSVVELGKHQMDPATRNYRDDVYDNTALTITWDLGFAELSSATTYFNKELDEFAEQPNYGFFPDSAGFSNYTQDDEYVSHETRLTSQSDGKLQWIAGIFYRDREINANSDIGSDYIVNVVADSGVPGQTQLLNVYFQPTTTTFDHKAVFGSVTYSMTDQLDLTAGFRYFNEKQTSDAQATIMDFGAIPGAIGDALTNGGSVNVPFNVLARSKFNTDDSDVTLRFNATYRIDDSWMVYGTAAEGFRSGGVNRNPATDFVTGAPLPNRQGFESDSLWNYEAGSKNTLMDGRLVLNSAIYLIKWEDIQVPGVINGVQQRWVTNAGKAESKGAEVEFRAYPGEGWMLNGAISYSEAELTAPAVGQPSGTALPAVSPWKYSFGLQYEFPLMDGLTGRIRADYSYLDDQPANLSTVSPMNGDYSLVNLGAAVESELWTVELFVDNATDEYASLGIDNGYLGRFRNRPQTIGLRFRWDIAGN